MKRISLIILFTAAISFASQAQDSKQGHDHSGHSHDHAQPATKAAATPTTPPPAVEQKPNTSPNAPEITFEAETIDYGTIKQGDEGTRIFKFKNTGKDPLVISNAKASCGCTVPAWSKEPIMKGETGELKVHYDTKRVGAFTKTITVESNAKSNPKVITIKGTVEASEQTDQATPFKKSEGAPLEMKTK
jgi:hypothetical protein